MHKNLRIALSLLTAIVLLSSCGKKAPKEAKYIPKDAAYTMVVDVKSLHDKLKKGNLGIDSIIKKIERITGDTMNAKNKQEWEDFKANGINQEGNLTFFMQQKGKSGQTYLVNVMAQVTDQSKLEAYLKKQEDSKEKVIVKESGYSYIRLGNNSMLSWNADIAMITLYQKQYKYEFDSSGNYGAADESIGEADMKKSVAGYFSQKESESMASVDYFKDMFKEKADGYFFTSSAGTLAALKSSLPLDLPKLDELLKDNYGTGTFNFEDGKIVTKGISYTNPQLTAILKKYPGASVNVSAVENFPSQNVNGFLLLSFNPEMIDGVLKEVGMDGIADGYLNKNLGISRAELIKALKGELNLAIGDFGVAPSQPAMYGQPNYKLLFSAAIGDKAAFNKLMDKAVEASQGMVVKTATGYELAAPMAQSTGFFLHTDDKYLYIARDSAVYAAYAAGKTKAKVDADVLNRVKGKIVGGYMNINSVVTGAASSFGNSPIVTNIVTIVNNTFKDMIFTADNFDGKSIKSEGEVRMVDTKQNSLVSIVNMFFNIGSSYIDTEKKMRQQYAPDSEPPKMEKP
jgi:hypothetical protein